MGIAVREVLKSIPPKAWEVGVNESWLLLEVVQALYVLEDCCCFRS